MLLILNRYSFSEFHNAAFLLQIGKSKMDSSYSKLGSFHISLNISSGLIYKNRLIRFNYSFKKSEVFLTLKINLERKWLIFRN